MSESSPESPAGRPRRSLLPVAVTGAALLAAAAVAIVLAVPAGDPATAAGAPVIPLAGHQVCADELVVDVLTDDEMARIAGVVHLDPRARKVYTETRTEAYQRFQQIFADQPDLIAGARPEALPASVTITATDGTDLHAWATELTKTFPSATSVRPLIRAEVEPAMAARYGTEGLRPCPPSGEWNG